MNQLIEFISDNTSLINLVQKLPVELHHDIMVLLGESFYADRTAKQTVEILKRRGKSLISKVDALKAKMQDLKASFFDSTASEVAEDLVEIREYEEDDSAKRVSQSGPVELESPSVAELDNKASESEDDGYARLMSRLEELEKEELAAEDDEENDEDEDANANATETDGDGDGDEDELTEAAFYGKKDEGYSSLDHGQRYLESQPKKQLQQSKGKDSMNEEMSTKYNYQDLTNQLACTGLTTEPVTKGEISPSRIIHQETKMLNPPVNAYVPSEKSSLKQNIHDSSRNEKPVPTTKTEFDSSKVHYLYRVGYFVVSMMCTEILPTPCAGFYR
ncbi:nonsense-mediated mRNA decay protein 2-like [Hibiscus syriacus]|uniref:nonsense-mediated mRNA decay protein 2-like n=1 Tax=Hibiscus syriacus TaxID=106335 RepID=UPI001923DD10|nr:nonsense-mediated mRNA decay protein 2-like [Hibiscus syriacus]